MGPVTLPGFAVLLTLIYTPFSEGADFCIFQCPEKCPFGFIPAGCPRCQCAPDPCLFTRCPAGFSCRSQPQNCPYGDCPHRAQCIQDASNGEQPCGCHHDFSPVCASNFVETVNFANECNMRCNLEHFIKIHDGFCHCNCPDFYDPVCGKDTNGEVSFVNNCWRSCNGVPLQHEGMCDCTCPLDKNEVCGNDGQTYINACVMGCAGVSKYKDAAC